ncbi:MAG: hypothetical protein ACREMH_00945 [Gemmatimonadales bacterium]
MTGPQILVRETAEERKKYLAPAPEFGWYLLGLAGAVFALVGLFDIALTWYPANFDSPEFQFASYSQSLNFMPLPALGLLLMLAGGIARGIRWIPKFVAGVLIVLTALILALAVFWALSAAEGLNAVKDPVVLRGLKKAIAKTALQAVAYPLAFVTVSVKAWRHSTAMTKSVP